jgi:hypothetical protein
MPHENIVNRFCADKTPEIGYCDIRSIRSPGLKTPIGPQIALPFNVSAEGTMRNKLPVFICFGGVAMLAGCGTNSQNEPFSPAAPVVSGNTPDGGVPRLPVIPEPMHTIRGGTSVTVRTTGTISSGAPAAGQTFHAVLIGNVLSDDSKVAIPRGSEATLVVKAVNGQGEIHGRLSLDLDSVTVDGRRYRLETDDIVEQGRQGPDENKRSVKFAGGALTGTIISAVAGGGKDAVIGPASGAGVAPQPVVRGSSISIPADSILTFRLESRVEVQPE